MRGMILGCLTVALVLAGCQEDKSGPAVMPHHAAVSKDEARKKGVDFLLSAKHGDHWISNQEWPEAGDQFGGEHGLVLYALLKTGQATHDPRLKPDSAQLGSSVAWEVHANTTTVYATALKVLVLCNATMTPDRAMTLSRCTGLLMRAMHKDGGYGYNFKRDEKQLSDSSNSDYALMAVAEASRHGVQVPGDYWVQAERFWRTRQNADGGWGYAPPELRPQSNMAMSAGAEASLYELLHRKTKADDLSESRKNIDDGWTYLNKSFDPHSSDYYYFYNMNRTGVSRIDAGHLAETITTELLSTQHSDGSWKTQYVSFWGEPNRTICTAYALLTLVQ